MNLRERACRGRGLRAGRAFGSLRGPGFANLAELLEFQSVRGGTTRCSTKILLDRYAVCVTRGTACIPTHRRWPSQFVQRDPPRPERWRGGPDFSAAAHRRRNCDARQHPGGVGRANFEALLIRYPLALSRVFVQSNFDFARDSRPVVEQRYAQTYVVIGLHEGADVGTVAADLKKAFAQRGRVHHFKPPQGGHLEPTSMDADGQPVGMRNMI